VRLRLKQHCFVFDSNIHVAHNAGRKRPNRNSVGIYRNRQPRGQLRGSRANTERIAQCGIRGTDCGRTDHTHGYGAGRCFIYDDKHVRVPEHRAYERYRRLLK
jgi:hypothetical protein